MTRRFLSAVKAASWHLGASALICATAAALVFRVWYPDGLHALTGGGALFLILMVVDVVCGPVLTLVLYNPDKPRHLWRMDLALIVLVQLGALGFGLQQVATARPIYLAFEGDRFRVVQSMDISDGALADAPADLRNKPLLGPEPLGVRLARPGDEDYLASVQLSLQGMHPALRPSRWQSYASFHNEVVSVARPLEALASKGEKERIAVDAGLRELGMAASELVYLPLVRDVVTDWVVVITRHDAQPVAFWHLDGW